MKTSTPLLRQFANLWTLTGQPTPAREWTLDEKFHQAKKAGFETMGGRVLPKIPALCEKYGMDYIAYISPSAKTYVDELEGARTMNPARIDVQLCDHDTPPREAVRVWLKVEALAKKMGLTVDLEVHRDTSTETPEKVDEIARLYRAATGRDLRFCFDHSHFAIVKHLSPPLRAAPADRAEAAAAIAPGPFPAVQRPSLPGARDRRPGRRRA